MNGQDVGQEGCEGPYIRKMAKNAKPYTLGGFPTKDSDSHTVVYAVHTSYGVYIRSYGVYNFSYTVHAQP